MPGNRGPRRQGALLLIGFGVVILGGFMATVLSGSLFHAPDAELARGSWAAEYQENLDAESAITPQAAALWSALDLVIFGQAPEGVVLGDSGWLFTEEEYSLAAEPQVVLTEWLERIAAVADRMAEAGIDLLVVPVPSKAKMVAQGQPPVPAIAQVRYETVLDQLEESGVWAVDLRPALSEQSAWLRTDTHWSPQGASAAADLIGAALTSAASESGGTADYSVTNRAPTDFAGDLHALLGLGRLEAWVGPPPEQLTLEEYAYESDPGTDLFAEVNVDIALVGTSYSAGEHWGLAERLEARTGTEVLDVSLVGRGPLAPMFEYLASPTFAASPPATVVWEIPARYMTNEQFLVGSPDPTDVAEWDAVADVAANAQPTSPTPIAVPLEGAPGAGTLVSVEHVGRLSPADVDSEVAGRFYNDGESPPFARTSVEHYVIEFLTTDADGAVATGTAQLFAPSAPADDALLAYAPGSTGMAPSCGPMAALRAGTIDTYGATALAYAGQGLPTVLPEYLYSLQPGGLQPYFMAHAEAAVVLDALRAATNALHDVGNGASAENVFIAGFSQGGHSALAAADRAASYAPDLPLKGVAGFGASGDLYTLFKHFHYTAPWALWAYDKLYGGLDLDAVLAPAYAAEIDSAVNDLCILGAQARYPAEAAGLYTQEFHTALTAGTMHEEFPELSELFDANATGLAAHGIPVILLHGVNDPVVPLAVQDEFVQQLCALGTPVRYANYLRTRHETRYIGFQDSLAWMRERILGNVPPSDC